MGPSFSRTSLTLPAVPRIWDLPLPPRLYSTVSTLVVAVLLLGLRLGDADRGDLGLAVGDAGDARVDDGLRVEAGDLLGDEDAVREAAVGELQAGDEVADGEDAVDVGGEALVGRHPAAVDRDAGLLVAHAGGVGAAADGDEDQIGLDRVAVLERHGDAGVGLLEPSRT